MSMRRAATVGVWAILIWSRGVRAEVDLAWEPPAQCAGVGSVVHVGLLAASDTGADQSLAGMDVVLTWDPATWKLQGVVENGPYVWLMSGFLPDSQLDGFNDSLVDGDAIYTALAGFGNPAMATPDGLLVTTFEFTALAPAEPTHVVIEAALGQHSLTQVFGADYPNQDVTGSLGEAAIRAVPLYDMNYDGFPSIIGDVPPFVDCVFFGDCNCPAPGCTCPGDCNCDGFLSIIGDVPCFVDCVFFGNCAECGQRGDSPGNGDGFTIGGVVYEDESKPLSTGLEGITINILDGERRAIASTRTAGPFGIWRIDNLPEGRYTVVLIGGGGKVPGWRHVMKITVHAENEAANQSIQLLRKGDVSKRPAR